MKHKHYEMIVAKAANTLLVKFVKLSDEWVATTTDEWNAFSDYFLCLPQHKEACLHWLNGGLVEENYDSQWSDIPQHSWSEQSVFNFDDGYKIRIKQHKEKRWIACNVENGNVYGMFSSKTECVAAWPALQIIEIEVEV